MKEELEYELPRGWDRIHTLYILDENVCLTTNGSEY